jgi:hypothetical protein
MANFDSPLGKKNFSGQQLREIDIPDETVQHLHQRMQQSGMPSLDESAIREFQNKVEVAERPEVSRVEEQIRAAKEARRTGIEKISEGAKRRIEMLIGMTKLTKDVDINGNVFTLQTLRGKEMRETIKAVSKFDGTIEGPFEMRKQFLARSITHIAGVEISVFLATDSLETKLSFIEELDESLLNYLYDQYLELSKSAREKFSLKTEEDVKEVLEDLKK